MPLTLFPFQSLGCCVASPLAGASFLPRCSVERGGEKREDGRADGWEGEE